MRRRFLFIDPFLTILFQPRQIDIVQVHAGFPQIPEFHPVLARFQRDGQLSRFVVAPSAGLWKQETPTSGKAPISMGTPARRLTNP